MRAINVFSGNASNLVQLSLKPEPWGNISHQRSFLENLAKKLNVNSKEDWYKVTTSTLKQHGGSELLRVYKGALYKVLVNVYPEYLILLSFHLHKSNIGGIWTDLHVLLWTISLPSLI